MDEAAKQLYTVFEKLCQCGEVPTDWKRGNTIPIFKKGKKGRAGELQASQSYRGLARSWRRSSWKLC